MERRRRRRRKGRGKGRRGGGGGGGERGARLKRFCCIVEQLYFGCTHEEKKCSEHHIACV